VYDKISVCADLLVKVFAKPPNDQEPEIFFYSMMFLVIAGGSGITMLLQVCAITRLQLIAVC